MSFFSRPRSSSSLAAEKHTNATSTTIPTAKSRGLALFSRFSLSLIYLLAWIFLILVEIGNINTKSVIRSTYLIYVDLSNIVPQSVPNAILINSIARSIGLHDFYQVGLWNFCEGYNDQGITHCSKTEALYWFDPVEIILNELLAGATIALPGNINSALKLVRIASHWMFSLFLVGTILSFISIFLAPLIISRRPKYFHRGSRFFLRSLPLTIIAFLTALFTTVASAIATVMFIIFRNVLTSQSDLNIKAKVGTQMLAFMWIATGFTLIGFVWTLGDCCAVCCCSGKHRARKRGLIDAHGHPINGIGNGNGNGAHAATTTTASAAATAGPEATPVEKTRSSGLRAMGNRIGFRKTRIEQA